MVKNGATTNAIILRTRTSNAGLDVTNFAAPSNSILGLTDTGFIVGTNAAANGSGQLMHYIACVEGNIAPPLSRTAS
jgi:hypothetical protein